MRNYKNLCNRRKKILCAVWFNLLKTYLNYLIINQLLYHREKWKKNQRTHLIDTIQGDDDLNLVSLFQQFHHIFCLRQQIVLCDLRRYVEQFSVLKSLLVFAIILDVLGDVLLDPLEEDGATHQLVDRSLRLTVEVADLDESELATFRKTLSIL